MTVDTETVDTETVPGGAAAPEAPADTPAEAAPRFAAGFSGPPDRLILEGPKGMEAYLVPVGPAGSPAEMEAFARGLDRAAESARNAASDELRRAMDAVPSKCDRLRAGIAEAKADAERLKQERQAAGQQARRAYQRGDDASEFEAAAEKAGREMRRAINRCKALDDALKQEEAAVRMLRQEVRRAIAAQLRAKASATAQRLAAELGNVVAERLPELVAARAVLDAVQV